MQNIYTNIRKFRELKSITREWIAGELDMSVSGYSKLERGEVDITLSKIYRIAEVLQVNPEQLLSFDAAQVFNISNNRQVNGLASRAETINFYEDSYADKYIKLLEAEIERLRNELAKKNK